MLLALRNVYIKYWWMVKSSNYNYVQQSIKYITIYINTYT